MKRVAPWLCGILLACTALLFSQTAEATHFRYGNVTWRLPDPTNAPLTVEFTVTVGWRSTFVDQTQLNFGDATNAPFQLGTQIGGGIDATGAAYSIYQYQVTHTYASPGVYTAFFQGGDRISTLINAADDLYRIESTVALDATGTNTSGPISGIPVIIQFEVNSLNQFVLPVFDPDADPHTCRFSTAAESGIQGTHPPQLPPVLPAPLGGDTLHFIAPGCSIEWDDTGILGASVGDRYAVSIAVESTHNGVVSKTTVDYIIEWVPANTKPLCTGGGNFTASVGMPFSQSVLGTDPQGGNLTLTANGLPAGSTTVPGLPATQPQPFNGTFNWTPGVADAGQSYLIQFTYTDPTNISDTCTLIVEVPQCAGFGDPCTVGIGACMSSGTIVCQGANPVCSVSPFPPGPVEICGNTVDEDCDGDFNDADACPDSDGDGVIDEVEIQIGSDPNDQDSDDDGVGDGDEPGPCLHSASCFEDTDGDGVINILDPDSDNDGLLDGTELGLDCSGADTDPASQSCTPDGDAGATVTDPLDADTDDGGVTDGSEDIDLDGVVDAGETNPTAGNGADDSDPANTDTDGDGLSDDFETNLGTDPNDQDSDDDGVLDGQEPNPSLDTDGDGLINPLDPDSDNDGLYDGTEMGFGCTSADTDPGPPAHCTPDGDGGATTTSPLDWDTDNGGASDGSEDQNLNGVIDAGETDPTAGNGADDGDAANTDTDGDGLSDGLETFLGSDPADGDSDDDGVLDGFEPNPADDTDGDGLANVLDVDSDDDGLYDGTELGLDCSQPDTDPGPPAHCFADGDAGATTTSPLLSDTDGGGVSDGSEDANLDGALDAGELDPLDDADDAGANDSDSDGLSDELETFLGSDPNDADTDDDGLLDGDEHNPSDHNDTDLLINLLDVDSDDDGLYDGTEDGQDCNNPDTALGHCIADADPTTTTSPLKKDTDGGGASDGSEDSNLNGAIDGTETNPTTDNGADDGDAVNADTDGDGLSDNLETFIGSSPDDTDSDDDGLPDSGENNPADDMDGDGDNNAADPDSDGDDLFDGTEKGNDCEDPGTDPAANNCIADADGGATTTNHLDADTDDGGIDDGDEDANHNGMIDGVETDPNDPSDDAPAPECTDDDDCPRGETCDPITMTCEPEGTGGAGGGGGAGGDGGDGLGGDGSGLTGGAGTGGTGGDAANDLFAVGGCDCSVPHRESEAPWLLFAAGALAVFTRRRRSSLERAS